MTQKLGDTVFRAALVTIAVVASAACYLPGQRIDAATQLGITGGLVAVAGAALAIAGLWAGLVFPEATKALLTKKKERVDSVQIAMTAHLHRTVLISCVVLVCCMAIPPAVALLKALAPQTSTVLGLRGLGFSIVVALSCAQSIALLQLLALGMVVRDGQSDSNDTARLAEQTQSVVDARDGGVAKLPGSIQRAGHVLPGQA